jgi:hypothetical protein
LKIRAFVLATASLSIAFAGCGSPSDDPSSGSERVYLDDDRVFMNVADSADTFTDTDSTGVYRIDSAGDYLYGGDVVAFDESSADAFTLKAGGKTYMNAYFMNAAGRFVSGDISFRL